MDNPESNLPDLGGFRHRWQSGRSGKSPKSVMIVQDKRLRRLHNSRMTVGERLRLMASGRTAFRVLTLLPVIAGTALPQPAPVSAPYPPSRPSIVT